MNIGFIGLGTMGHPMALNLHKAGHALIVPERKSLPQDVREVAQVVDGPAAAARAAEAVILMLPDTPDVEAVLFGPGGVAGAEQDVDLRRGRDDRSASHG